jgi:N-sulfoglucosamine sulfohydrolase
MNAIKRIWLCLVVLSIVTLVQSPAAQSESLNIVWILGDDVGPALGCYGEPMVRTPHLDRLATEGVRYTACFTTSPICSPSRSAMFTGRYQTTINAHQHRTEIPRPLSEGVKTITEHFRAAGYFTVNLSPSARPPRGGEDGPGPGSGKTDLNFLIEKPYDSNDWNTRRKGQPFFAHVNILAPHRGSPWHIAQNRAAPHLDPDKVRLPPYAPDHPIVREDYINYLKAVELMDDDVGRVLARLERENLLDRTIVVFVGDNGECLFRSKQFLYDGGLHVPLIIRWPDLRRAGEVDHQLVSGIDLTVTVMALAGLKPDPGMHGRDFVHESTPRREFIFAARDRAGLAIDRMRAVRSDRYKYIRNYLYGIPYMQVNPYKERVYPVWNLLKDLAKEDRLSPAAALFTAGRKPAEELYDLQTDPHEVNNLAQNPAHIVVLRQMREALETWIERYGDDGALMEDPLDIIRTNPATAKDAGMTPLE